MAKISFFSKPSDNIWRIYLQTKATVTELIKLEFLRVVETIKENWDCFGQGDETFKQLG